MPTRRFDAADQLGFAALSGDHNPMHMDAAAARRTPAGAPVVHGVQSMLWALDCIARVRPLERLVRLDADFARFLYVGDTAELAILLDTDTEVRAEIRCAAMRVSHYVLKFAPAPVAASGQAEADPQDGLDYPASRMDPLPLEWDQVAASAGTVAFVGTEADIAASYPDLTEAIGVARIGALLALTRLVGMVSPGLHSTFHRIAATLTQFDDAPDQGGRLRFSVAQAEPRYQLVTFDTVAPGLRAKVKASRRTPPTRQPDSAALRGLVARGAFAGRKALIVGGSRGLGEVAAKLLALGGAEVWISYATGAEDAALVAEDIVSEGGVARTLRLDVLDGSASGSPGALAALPADLTSMYYFATRRIAPRTGSAFDATLFTGFCEVYVEAFAKLCETLVQARTGTGAGNGAGLSVFYPSTVYVDEAPTGLAEYAMAKAAGEVCAANLQRSHPGLRVLSTRLPRMATDQTAGMIAKGMAPVADCLLPVIARIETSEHAAAA